MMFFSSDKNFTLARMEREAQKPESVGMSLQKLQEIDFLLERHIEAKHAAGAVALLVRKGKTAYFQAKGMQSIEKEELMKKDTICTIASMTKAITSVAAMLLFEEGKLLLDDFVSGYIPAFKELKIVKNIHERPVRTEIPEGPLTLRHLLTHTSGIGYTFLHAPLYEKSILESKRINYLKSLEENMPFFAGLPLMAQPGDAWVYGYSSDILGHIIEIVSGLTLEEFFIKRIFKPLGMKDTCFDLPVEKFSRYATRYEKLKDGTLKPFPHRPASLKVKFLSGGGGLLSTAIDYGRFLQMLLNKGVFHGHRFLQASTVELMTRNHIGELCVQEPRFSFLTGEDKFGLGFLIHTSGKQFTSIGSYSWGGIFNTWYWVDPQEDLLGVLLTQVVPFSNKESVALCTDFQKTVYRSLQ